MTVQELIDELNNIDDKSKVVVVDVDYSFEVGYVEETAEGKIEIY